MVNGPKSEEEIYYAVLEQPLDKRASYVKAACGDDLDLLERLESLLKIRESGKNKLIIVGGAKVPGIIYKLSDWNISITSQPHSEISALSIFLHELFQGEELLQDFKNAKLKIIPQSRGKKVLDLE